MTRLRVGVLGATGLAGQQVVAALQHHPWFALTALAASERSTGKRYGEALRDAGGASLWFADGSVEAGLEALTLIGADALARTDVDLVFSAVAKEPALEWEPKLAQRVPVISTASAFRYDHDVPLLLPGINNHHASVIPAQRRARGWRGFIAPIPNCTTTGLAISLKPLQDRFGLRLVAVTSMQAVSGAGRAGGVLALDVIDNVIPYIPGEEEKVARETTKILGCWDEQFKPAPVAVTCTCTRVNVQDGHTEAVFVATERPADAEAAIEAMEAFAPEGLAGLPSAPERLLRVVRDPYRPQPRRDRDVGGGMTVTVGRLRSDGALGGVKYVVVSHNTKLGAGKGAVLLAEWLTKQEYIASAL